MNKLFTFLLTCLIAVALQANALQAKDSKLANTKKRNLGRSPSTVLYDGFAPTTPGVGPSPSNQTTTNDPFRYFEVYLPQGYNDSGNKKRYPVVYFLHGFGQNFSSYGGIFPVLDQLIGSGVLEPFIMIKPDGSLADGYLGSFFVNSVLNGNFEDYIVGELRAFVNAHYRTKVDAASTQIVGHSMGGYGAYLLALKHPAIYGTVVAHSPSTVIAMAPQIFNPNFYNPVLNEIPFAGPAAGKVLPLNGPHTYQLFALAAALSPNLGRQPFMVDLPIEVNPDFSPVLTNGKLTPNIPVLNRWLRNDPYTLVKNSHVLQDKLRSKKLYIDSGLQEPFIDTTGAYLFVQLLKSLNIPLTFQTFSGSAFPQQEKYTPSNDIQEKLVFPVVQGEAQIIEPNPALQPNTLVNLATKAIGANPAGITAATFANFGAFATMVCKIPLPDPNNNFIPGILRKIQADPATAGQLLIDPQFQACLKANGINPPDFIAGYFQIFGDVTIDPTLFGIDTDGFFVPKSSLVATVFQSKFCPTKLILPVH